MSFKNFFSGPGRAFVIIALVVCAASFYVGRGMGYDTGHAVAAMSANSAAEAKYQEGYDAGKEKGLAEGKLEGIKQGREEMTKIYESKLDAEYSKGYNKGHADGYEEGRKDAYAEMNGIEAEDQYLAGEAPSSSSELVDPNTYTVWLIGEGTKYHEYDCPERKEHGGRPVTLAEAWSMGKGACAKCNPPIPVPAP